MRVFKLEAPPWLPALIGHYKTVLAGGGSKTWDRDDIRMVKIEFVYTGQGDGWSIFEQTYPHSVGGSCTRDGREILDSTDFNKAEAAEVCHKMNTAQMPGFEFVSMTLRD